MYHTIYDINSHIWQQGFSIINLYDSCMNIPVDNPSWHISHLHLLHVYIITGKKLTKCFPEKQSNLIVSLRLYTLVLYIFSRWRVFPLSSHQRDQKKKKIFKGISIMVRKIFSQINSISNIINLYSFREENILTNFPQSGSNSFQFYLKRSVVSPTLHTNCMWFFAFIFLSFTWSRTFSL